MTLVVVQKCISVTVVEQQVKSIRYMSALMGLTEVVAGCAELRDSDSQPVGVVLHEGYEDCLHHRAEQVNVMLQHNRV